MDRNLAVESHGATRSLRRRTFYRTSSRLVIFPTLPRFASFHPHIRTAFGRPSRCRHLCAVFHRHSHLLNNAAKYTPKGGTIALSVEATEAGVVVRDKDNGVGIDPGLLPYLFDLFKQADRSLARSEGGLGIGLSLVRHIAELHGGTVEAVSAGLGQGSEFVLRLPVRPLADSSPPMRPEPLGASAVTRRILIVEDHVDMAESLRMLLNLRGHETRYASSGPAALEAAVSFKPEVVILNIGLQGMSGYDLAKQLRDLPETRTAYLIAVTGYGHPEDRQRSQAAGINAHCVKPVDPEALNRMIISLKKPHSVYKPPAQDFLQT